MSNAKKKVHIVKPWLGPEGALFTHYGFDVTTVLEEADIICFTGGSDINPELYGAKLDNRTHYSPSRDKWEVEQWNKARELEIPIVGICRGGQLACALSGGKLHQHVENHNRGSHKATLTVGALPNKEGFEVVVTSMHHQMMVPSAAMKVLMTANQQAGNPDEGDDIEALWCPETKALAFQGHPEFAIGKPCSDIFIELIKHYIPSCVA